MSSNMENSGCLDQVETTAAAWILKREGPRWSAADEAALAEWLQTSASHRVSFMRLRSAWRDAGRLQVVSGAFSPGKVPVRGTLSRSPFFSAKRRAEWPHGVAPDMDTVGNNRFARRTADAIKLRHLLAASVLVVLAFGLATYWRPAGGSTYSTPVGGLASVPMDDGSKVTLNTNSQIQLDLGAQERRVNLIRGEAFFVVAKDPQRPFVVYAAGKRVVAVGTQFAVRLKPDALQVSVTEGHVRIEKEAVVGNGRPLADLMAGSIASTDASAVFVQEKPVADIEQALSWRRGYIVLRKAQLTEAVTEFNRYNRRQLVIADPLLAGIKVGGNFKSDNIDGFVRLLQEGFAIEADEREGAILLTHKSPANPKQQRR